MAQSSTTIQNSLSAGELSPSIWGRTDLEKYHHGTSTCRNFFANYKGGIMSRGGFAYVGTSKQTYPSSPPRLIPFQFNLTQGFVLEFGEGYMRVISDGGYVLEGAQPVTAITNADPGRVTYFNASGYTVADGDWVFIYSQNPIFSGGTANYLNGLAWVASNVIGASFTPVDMFGNTIDTTNLLPAYSGSQASNLARIYTVTSPYAAVDLPYLKYTQSADVMTLTCVNTDTGTEYPPYFLVRNSNTNWAFSQVSFASDVDAPTGLVVTANSSTTPDTWYSYVVTALVGSEESVASSIGSVENNDISINAGSNSVTWAQVDGATSYNIYAATPSYSVTVPVSSLFGFIGTTLAPGFVDNNTIPDFTKTPPIQNNPFATYAISDVIITAVGANYTQETVGYTVTGAGTRFAGFPVVNDSGQVSGFIITNHGHGYTGTPTIAFTDSGIGAGATGTLTSGASSGTYPSVSAFYQQRQVYASTLNQPETYWMSRPGLYTNFDASIPVIDSDSIEGTPWAQQVNGIQWLVPMPGGLVVLTGNGAWQVNGGSQAAITPSSQTATPQAYNGCSGTVPPIVRNYDILYLQAKGSIFRDLSYNFFVNIYTGTDLTVLSDHLFYNFSMVEWCSAEEPYKLLWVVRSDGNLLCLTYVKEQEVYSWTRHDTNGLFRSICSVTELPVDAVYVVVQRYIQGAWRYYVERMDNRLWNTVEEAFCVDSGLTSPVTYPNATLSPSAATGDGVTFTTSASVFNSSYVDRVIRVGGGKGVIATYVNTTTVTVDISEPIVDLIPNNPDLLPSPQPSGNWSITNPSTTIHALNHLEDLEVSVLADGSVVENQVVTDGMITIPYEASLITIGLPFTCQAQTLYLDHPDERGNTIQNKRKNISAVGLRVANTRGLKIGADQPDQSIFSSFPTVTWSGLSEIKERTQFNYAGVAIPLYTGDYYKAITSSWTVKGQIAIQQDYPLPAQVLATVAYWLDGDDK